MNNKYFINCCEDFEDFSLEELLKQWQEEKNKAYEKFSKCGEKKDDDNKEYFHRVEKDYVNGKCVRSREKEIVDGEVIIDKDFSEKVENNTEKKSLDTCCCDKRVKETAPVALKLQQLENYVNDIDAKFKEVQEENGRLKSMLEKAIDDNERYYKLKNEILRTCPLKYYELKRIIYGLD